MRALGLENVEVDAEYGVIRSRQDEPEAFELHPYRLAVGDFLRRRVPELLDTSAADAHFHVCAKCLLCEYLEADKGCQKEADAGFDLSRVAYVTSESKRHLLAAGLPTHRHLARLDPGGDVAARLRERSHDLSVHLDRYVAAARALEDGEPRALAASTLQMPYKENVRVVLSAEQDGVTGTVFALGIKTKEGWNAERGRYDGTEEVFIAEERDAEADLLLRFLRTLNGVLERVDDENRAVTQTPLDEEADVKAAAAKLDAAEGAFATFKEGAPSRLYKARPEHAPLVAERTRLQEAIKSAKDDLKQTRKQVGRDRWNRQQSLHVYLYDNLDLEALKSALERHLLEAPPELRREIVRLVRLFPPDSVLADADTLRTIPGTVVVSALRQLVALPVPYLYDLESVSKLYRPHKKTGEESGWGYRFDFGFGWKHSNQVAFERIHDVWDKEAFVTKTSTLSWQQVRAKIEKTVRDKLRATDSVIQRLQEDHKAEYDAGRLGFLLLHKEPFRLHEAFDPTDFEAVEALRVFTLVESALEELQTKHLHTLSPTDRAAKFEAIRGLRYLPGRDTQNAAGETVLWFGFDGACRDAKFTDGDDYLVATPEGRPEVLVNEVDGRLFEGQPFWRYKAYQVALETLDFAADPPRAGLRPKDAAAFRAAVDLAEPLVLDKTHSDITASWVLDTLARLRANPTAALHVAALVQHGTVPGWSPFFRSTPHVAYDLKKRMKAVVGDDGEPLDPDRVLNAAQWEAWRGVFFEPLTMIWGPPGTGKTHLLGHILIGYALAAKRMGQPLRLLVTAFTHHAIANVLKKAADLAVKYGLDADDLGIVKLGDEKEADRELAGTSVEHLSEGNLAGAVDASEPRCLVVGSTVWSVYKTSRGLSAPGRPTFDVVLVDEASQLKLPDAIIAFAALKPEGSVILAGDDQQLPPIIHGTYPEEHEPMLSSVFAFARHKLEQRDKSGAGAKGRCLFPLTRNFRMNEPLTAYPREVIYDNYEAHFPDRKIALDPPTNGAPTNGAPTNGTADLVDLALHPERPAVLVWYTPPRSFTARNALEAEIAARIVLRLSRVLVDPDTRALYEPKAFAERGVAVLAPHNAQNAAIRTALRDLGFDTPERPMPLVDTVDKLQGKERDVVVMSYGVADAEYADAEADFLLSKNRFNVSATRGRSKLVVLCSDVVLDAVPDDKRVLLESMMLKEFRTYCADGAETLAFEHPEYGEVDLTVQWKGFESLRQRVRGGRRGMTEQNAPFGAPLVRKNASILSPLRYPGGKRRLVGYVGEVLRLNRLRPKLYVEPFAGGASVALQLLNDGLVERVGLGEKDPLVASFWRTVFWDHEWLIKKVRAWEPSLPEWERLKAWAPTRRRDKAIKCLFLNRTSFSGILSDTAGPIGGRSQESEYGIGCRFPQERIVRRIEQAAALGDRVAFVQTGDWTRTIARAAEEGLEADEVFFYLDPPFFKKADRLYRYYFDEAGHRALRDGLAELESPYLLSYDAAPEIEALYDGWEGGVGRVGLLYSATGSENLQEADEFVVTSLPDLPSATRLWRTQLEWRGDGAAGATPCVQPPEPR